MSTSARPVRLAVAGAATLLALGAVGCSSTDSASTSSTTAKASASSASSGSTGSGGSTASAKVSANDATEAELVAAFEAAGIANAAKWADEVMEYRPYPTDDPELTALQEELAKYNPSPETLQQILDTLEP